jgi:hypothetical protein
MPISQAQPISARSNVARSNVARSIVADHCRSNFAAEREKQTRKQLEDALAPLLLSRMTIRPEQSS